MRTYADEIFVFVHNITYLSLLLPTYLLLLPTYFYF